MSDGPGLHPDDVKELSSCQAPFPPGPGEFLGSSSQKPREVVGLGWFLSKGFPKK